ncbi:MAG: ABC transporter substrate-binding protein [Treponema sp.]|nr:ABC transporter substrate-binding protein [Treponema sp.]
MKKIVSVAVALVLSASFGVFAKAKTVTIETLNGKNEKSAVDVPYNPKRIAILDFAALDIIDNLGLGNRVVGCASTSIDYLSKYSPDKNRKIKNIGNIKTPDMEAVFECEPDVIFISGRLASKYDELSKIAPVVYLSTDMNIGLVKSVKKNASTIASIFGKEKDAEKKFSGLESRIKKISEKASGKTAVLSLVTSGSCNLLGNTGRLNLIANEIGFDNIGASLSRGNGPAARGKKKIEPKADEKNLSPEMAASQAHGEESSFELIAKLNPSYIFVLDRDSAIGTKGAKLAKDIMNNEIVNMTDAAKNNHLVILPSPAIWYTAEGGITALDYMLKDLEGVL